MALFKSKREPGYGGVGISVKLWCDSKSVIKEIKAKICPHLTKEEEEKIIRLAQDGRSIWILVPQKEYFQVAENKIEMKTCSIFASPENAAAHCCPDWWRRGCCGGPQLGMRIEVPRMFHKPTAELAEDLTNYYIRSR